MKKFTLFLTLLVAMVSTAMAQVEFDNNKCYIVSTIDRGGWSVNDDLTQFCSTNDAGRGTTVDAEVVNNQFAVLTAGEGKNYYLYSVAAKKFVNANRTLTSEPCDPIEWVDASSKGAGRIRVNFKGVPNSFINLGGEKQMTVDWWSDIDNGNAVLFTEVENADFDPSDALQKLSNTVTVKYVFMYDGKVVEKYSQVKNDVVVGANYPAVTVKLPYGVTATLPDGKVSEEGATNGVVTKDVTLTISRELPFVAAASADEITNWYYMQMHWNNKKYVNANGTAIEWAAKAVPTDNKDAYTWGFVGNVWDGFKVVNYAAYKEASNNNTTLTFANGATSLTTDENAHKFVAVHTGWSGASAESFCLEITTGNYLNAQNATVASWNDADAGSTICLEDRSFGFETVETGKYYTIKSKATDKYIYPGYQGQAMNMSDTPSIFYYNGDSNLICYGTGYFMNGANHAWLNYKGTYNFKGTESGYLIRCQNNYLSAGDDKLALTSINNPVTANCEFVVEEVTELPVKISSARWATFYSEVALEIPKGVHAYYIAGDEDLNDNLATLIELENAIPAYVGVLLYTDDEIGTEGKVYNFRITEGVEFVLSRLYGSVENKEFTSTSFNYYILANPIDEVTGKSLGVGLYKDKFTNGKFYNNGHKAYLQVGNTEPAAQSAGFRFEFGTTGIEDVESAVENNVYYDLSGRRVENPVKGIYIVNGKKVLVK